MGGGKERGRETVVWVHRVRAYPASVEERHSRAFLPFDVARHGATVHAFASGTSWIVHSDVYDFNGSEYLMGQSAYHPRHELPIRIAAS